MFFDKIINRTIELPTNYGDTLYIPIPISLPVNSVQWDNPPEYAPSVRFVYRLRGRSSSRFFGDYIYTYEFEMVEMR